MAQVCVEEEEGHVGRRDCEKNVVKRVAQGVLVNFNSQM